jgi:hypothetical protein
MRAIIGLAALAAVANAQSVQITGDTTKTIAQPYTTGSQPQLSIVSVLLQSSSGAAATVTGAGANSVGIGFISTASFVIYTPNSVSAIYFSFITNTYTAQLQYKWGPNYTAIASLYPTYSLSSTSFTCDLCAGGSPISCNTANGPGSSTTTTSPVGGFSCANLNRQYLLTGLVSSTPTNTIVNTFAAQVFDLYPNQPNTNSYSFTIVRTAPAHIVGDPQISGMQGQDFQVHGMPDEIFNMVSSEDVQVNARFSYLESAACHDNYTACFAHPGTYISEEGFRIGKDKVRVTAGSFKKGLTVHVNGKKAVASVQLAKGSVEIVNHRRVVVDTPLMTITVTNSDKFMNQEMELKKGELVSLGSKRRVLKDNERFHPEVPVHGLQGQTWRNVEYPSGLEYEGSIMDYHVVSGNLFGTDFTFNQFLQ